MQDRLSSSLETNQWPSPFKAYDVRGIVGEGLTADLVFQVGQAVASELSGNKTVVVGYDGRLTSPELSRSLREALILSGCRVIDIGLVPTPLLYFMAIHGYGGTGVMVTGSHNPPEYNGLKILIEGVALSGERIQRLKSRIKRGGFVENKGSVEVAEPTQPYMDYIKGQVKLSRPLKIVVDGANGAAADMAPQLLRELGCDVIELHCNIDGTFPGHPPDPSQPENLADLISGVIEHQADIGLAFDGDGDRLGVVDNEGAIIWPDRQLMLYVQQVLPKYPGRQVVYDIKCSSHLAKVIENSGGTSTMCATGHSIMKAKMKETNAVLGGEISGHIFFNDRWFGFDDGLYTAARLVEILSKEGRPASELFAELPGGVCTPEIKIPLGETRYTEFMQQLHETLHFPDGNINTLDGIRVEFDDCWGLIRTSNTTPNLVCRFEADTQEALIKIQAQFKTLLLQVEPGLQLPF